MKPEIQLDAFKGSNEDLINKIKEFIRDPEDVVRLKSDSKVYIISLPMADSDFGSEEGEGDSLSDYLKSRGYSVRILTLIKKERENKANPVEDLEPYANLPFEVIGESAIREIEKDCIDGFDWLKRSHKNTKAVFKILENKKCVELAAFEQDGFCSEKELSEVMLKLVLDEGKEEVLVRKEIFDIDYPLALDILSRGGGNIELVFEKCGSRKFLDVALPLLPEYDMWGIRKIT